MTGPSLVRTGQKWRTQSSLIGFDSRFPSTSFYLRFQPTGEINFSDEYVRPFTEDLKSIPADTILYNILALDQPEELGGAEAQIGKLVLRFSLSKLLQTLEM